MPVGRGGSERSRGKEEDFLMAASGGASHACAFSLASTASNAGYKLIAGTALSS